MGASDPHKVTAKGNASGDTYEIITRSAAAAARVLKALGGNGKTSK